MRFTEYSQQPSGLNIIPVTAMRKMRLTGVRLYAYEKADLVFEPSFVWLKAYVVSPVPWFVNVFPVSNCLHEKRYLKILKIGTSLVAQWLKIHLPMQATHVRALVQGDTICCGATKPMCHNY